MSQFIQRNSNEPLVLPAKIDPLLPLQIPKTGRSDDDWRTVHGIAKSGGLDCGRIALHGQPDLAAEGREARIILVAQD